LNKIAGMKLQKLISLIALLLLFGGVWQSGHGVYIQAKALLAQHLMHKAWASILSGQQAVKPWPWADTWPIARLRSLEHDTDLIVLHGASGRSLAFGPGHVTGTALPGRNGVSVISAHRDTHFRFLKALRLNDVLLVQAATGEEHRYRVTDIRVVDGRKLNLLQDTTRSRIALVTCYPFNAIVPGGVLRYVVTIEEESDNSSV